MPLFENELRLIAEIKAEIARTKRRFRRAMVGLSLGCLVILAGAALWLFVL
jgi:enterochelin esterase-like enzyme